MAIETHTDIDELMERIEKLSLRDQLQLVELVTRRIRESISGGTPAVRVRGLLATDQAPPTDSEVETILTDALEEKYR